MSASGASDAPGYDSRGPTCWKCSGTGSTRPKKQRNKAKKRGSIDDGGAAAAPVVESAAAAAAASSSAAAAVAAPAAPAAPAAITTMTPCGVCDGNGFLPRKRKEMDAASRPGVVKAARSFASGWKASGPLPLGAQGDPELEPKAGEELCFLCGHWRIYQRVGGHRYSTDDVVTAWMAARVMRQTLGAGRPVRRQLDIGCGIGSVLMMTAWRHPEAQCVGVEAQSLSFSMACRGVKYNGLLKRCEVRQGDLRDPTMVPEGNVFDLVTGTPPYFEIKQVAATASGTGTNNSTMSSTASPKAPGQTTAAAAAAAAVAETETDSNSAAGGSAAAAADTDADAAAAAAAALALTPQGGMPSCEQSAPARFEFRGGIEAYCEAASRCIHPEHGRFVVVVGCATASDDRVCRAAHAVGLIVLEKLTVRGKAGKVPLIAVYVMRKASETGKGAEGEAGGGGGTAAATTSSAAGASAEAAAKATHKAREQGERAGVDAALLAPAADRLGDGTAVDALERAEDVLIGDWGAPPFREMCVAVRDDAGAHTVPYRQILLESGFPV